MLICFVFFQVVFGAVSMPITDQYILADQLDRAVKADDQGRVLSLLNEPAQKKLTSYYRNGLLERAMFFHHFSKDMASFLLQQNGILKANQLGMDDILRGATAQGRVDIIEFVLFNISEDQLRPSEEVIGSACVIAKDRGKQEIMALFERYEVEKS